MAAMGQPHAVTSNEEIIEAWDGVLFDRFVEFREVLVEGLGAHGELALRENPPLPGERVVDIGCGFGDTAQRIAGMVGPEGSVLGVDASPRFIETSRQEAEAAGVANVRFEVCDPEDGLEGEFDMAFSRMGTMFFANPVAALRNIRSALRPGGRLCMVVWRAKVENPWMYRSEEVVERFVEEPEDSDEPTCGPGPFSMANADTVSGMLVSAGFTDIGLRRSDQPMRLGNTPEEAVGLATAIGPAAEVLRLAGDAAEELRPKIEAELRDLVGEFDDGGAPVAPTSTWIVTATAP
jgi:SAM-dependent methyltransferase